MKKIIMFFSLLLVSTAYLNAQNLYSTHTGQIKFYASTPLENVEAVNNEVESKMLQKNGQIIFAVLIQGFHFANALMQDHFNENYMESTKYPKADFKGFITNIASVNFSKDGKYNITGEGDLTVHGVTKKITTTGVLEIAGGKVSINSVFKINLKDFKVTGSYIGTKIAEQVQLTVNCKYD